jgi:ribonuclease T1
MGLSLLEQTKNSGFLPVDADRPFAHDTLKLRAVFVPKDSRDKVSAGNITAALGYDTVKIPAIFVPEGSEAPRPGYPFVHFGRYVWRADGGMDVLKSAPGGGSAADPAKGTGNTGNASSGQPTARRLPPTPTPAVTQRYVDPVKTAVATWRGINMLAPSAQPVASRATDGPGQTVARPNANPGESADSVAPCAYTGNDPLNATDPTGLFASVGSGVTAALQGKGGSGSIVQAGAESEIESNSTSPAHLQAQEPTPESPVQPSADPKTGAQLPGVPGGGSVATVPPAAQTVVQNIDQGGPFPYARDGTMFNNREGLLPAQSPGYYTEYTVPTEGISARGAQRIVAGQGGELYYSPDHYGSFQRIR